jgi:HK97 family phage portal protein
MGFVSRIGTALGLKAAEGEPRPGPYWLPVTQAWLPAGSPWNFWQCDIDPAGYQGTAMVEACVAAYARTVAMCSGDHWRALPNGGRERVETSALNRILRRPNDYETISDFLLNLTRSLYLDGNAYALAVRNDRFEIAALHLMSPRSSRPVAVNTGATTREIFYELGGNAVIDEPGTRLVVPARDVLHVRLASKDNSLLGTSPLEAAALDAAASGAITAQQLAFYRNQARPSQVLTTDKELTAKQRADLREAWNAQSQGLAQGGTPILGWGLKPANLAVTGNDAAMAESLKLADQHIALVFGVPLAILGIGPNTYGSTEALMSAWLAQSLTFTLNHIEKAFDNLFGLRGEPHEYLELNTAALLRVAEKDRIEALAKSVISGIRAPDEARAELEYGRVPGGAGKEPRVQQQVVPLSAWDKQPPATPRPDAPPPAPAADAANDDDDEAKGEERRDLALIRLRRAVAAAEARHAA